MPAELVQTKRYLSIRDGLMEERKGDQTIAYNHLSGMHVVFVDFRKVEKEKDGQKEYVGDTVRLHLVDESDYWQLEMWANSGYAKAFYHIMENIDYAKPVTIITQLRNNNGKKQQAMFISQDAKPLKWKYTRDNPGDLPPLKITEKLNAQGLPAKQYNDDDQMLFFMDKIATVINPYLKLQANPFPFHTVWKGWHTPLPAEPEAPRETTYHGPFTDAIDDLPF